MTDHKKLDRILDLRRHEEQRRTVELAMAHQAVRDADAAVRQLEAQRSELERALQNLSGESVGLVKTFRLLLEQVEQSVHNALTVRALAEATVEEKIERLEQANRSREALQRVVVPRHAQARALERMAEQKQEDEASAHRFRSGEQAAS
jgi:flagellar export protein FliJ